MELRLRAGPAPDRTGRARGRHGARASRAGGVRVGRRARGRAIARRRRGGAQAVGREGRGDDGDVPGRRRRTLADLDPACLGRRPDGGARVQPPACRDLARGRPATGGQRGRVPRGPRGARAPSGVARCPGHAAHPHPDRPPASRGPRGRGRRGRRATRPGRRRGDRARVPAGEPRRAARGDGPVEADGHEGARSARRDRRPPGRPGRGGSGRRGHGGGVLRLRLRVLQAVARRRQPPGGAAGPGGGPAGALPRRARSADGAAGRSRRREPAG